MNFKHIHSAQLINTELQGNHARLSPLMFGSIETLVRMVNVNITNNSAELGGAMFIRSLGNLTSHSLCKYSIRETKKSKLIFVGVW